MSERERQLAYSDVQQAMHDETGRRTKARKIIAVLTHFFGRERLDGLVALDLGSSTGYISDELRRAGAAVIGADIDAPGLASAQRRFPAGIGWLLADGSALPLPSASIDVIVFNQIYEHVVDPDAVLSEIRRVLRPGGAAYLGLGNRLTVMEPHVSLPFASWLPPSLADRYVRLAGRGDRYHERFRTKAGLRRLTTGLHVWDYTWTIIAEPRRFCADDMVRGPLQRVPLWVLRLMSPVTPTYIWIATTAPARPRGAPTVQPPTPVAG